MTPSVQMRCSACWQQWSIGAKRCWHCKATTSEPSPKRSQKDTNPKTIFGQAKPPLGLIPGVAEVHMAEAFRDGADKYGPANWRDDPVSASTYVSALKRHLAMWVDGEECDPVSGVHHLGSVLSNAAILLDAQACGSLIDDRPKHAPTADLIRKLTRPIKEADRG